MVWRTCRGCMFFHNFLQHQQGVCPLAVVATAASTVIGAFDPLEEIAALCEKYSVWMHVDGCFGSSILMSRKHKAKARGIERSVGVGGKGQGVKVGIMGGKVRVERSVSGRPGCLVERVGWLAWWKGQGSIGRSVSMGVG